MFFLRKRFWIRVLQVMALVFVGAMGLIQVPELLYDLGNRTPISVEGPAGLTRERFPRATFAAVSGTADFEHAFVYRRYGLSYTYFTLAPYGPRLVVRTHDRVTDAWRDTERFLGRLRPFDKQPFSYRIREIFADSMGVEIPGDAFFLGLDDVPRPSAWQIGAVIFAGALWILLFGLFFLRRRRSG